MSSQTPPRDSRTKGEPNAGDGSTGNAPVVADAYDSPSAVDLVEAIAAELAIPEDPPPPVTELASRSRIPQPDEPTETDEARLETSGHEQSAKPRLAVLGLAALGVVFGDIGTSPLYSLRECFAAERGLHVAPSTVLGVLSLIIWALTLTVSVKYVSYVLRADNRGEGGVLALMALAASAGKFGTLTRLGIVLLGLFGAALLYGDGMITPAISVLSAVEGLTLVEPAFGRFVRPLTVVILVLLFAVQRFGTARVGRVFGPVMLLWFMTLAVLGVAEFVKNPLVLAAFDPLHGLRFLFEHGQVGFFTLGSVLLVVTGGEALYADMGHFGSRPIRVAWYVVAMPALALNYLGQGAFLLAHPDAVERSFFGLAPAWATLPLVLLSTLATIIASQALISGVFSITRQAVMLGYWPRVRILHTSSHETGQIYVPSVNWMLMAATCALVLSFGSSSNLASAYGVAVTATMAITTLLAFVVAVRVWRWPLGRALVLTSAFLVLDLAFFCATIVKLPSGGWVPLAVGFGLLMLMTTWRRGRVQLAERTRAFVVPLNEFIRALDQKQMRRVPGTAVFMTSESEGAPPALVLNTRFNHVVHERVILLTLVTDPHSFVREHERVERKDLGHGFVRVVAHYGFMETPNVPGLLERHRVVEGDLEHVVYFVGRETINVVRSAGMPRWRKRFFAFLDRNGAQAPSVFGLPSSQVAEVGTHVDL